MFTLTVNKILLSESSSVLPPVQRGTGSKKVNEDTSSFKQIDQMCKCALP